MPPSHSVVVQRDAFWPRSSPHRHPPPVASSIIRQCCHLICSYHSLIKECVPMYSILNAHCLGMCQSTSPHVASEHTLLAGGSPSREYLPPPMSLQESMDRNDFM